MGSLALAVVLALVLAPPTPAAAAAEAVVKMPASGLNAMWTAYGNAGGHWTGGDRTVSVALPDGRVVWLFSDTFLGTVNADGSRPSNSPMVHNTLVIQDGNSLTETRHGGTPSQPKSYMCDDNVGLGCWVADAIVDNAKLRVLVNRYERTGPGSLDVKPTGTALVTLALPGLTVEEVRDLPLGSTITWGQELLNEGGFTYIYGSEHTPDTKFAHLARVPEGGLAGSWQFWTGTGWSSNKEDSARIASGVGTAFAVQKVDGQYLLVTMEGHLVFNSIIVAYTAGALTGPFGGPVELARAPEGNDGRQVIAYDTDLHPELAADGKLLISYNVNSLDNQVNLDDVSVYRPRFIEVNWPRPQPNPALLPPAPTSVSAAAGTEGGVRLAWNAVAGDGIKYWIYQKDMTAGQIQWVRLPQATTQTSIDLDYLKNGHVYEYRVTAQNDTGEGPTSPTVTASVSVQVPAAPANLTANADLNGQISLDWDAVARSWYYEVEQRDVTAGQVEFSRVAHPDGTATALTVKGLEHRHEYEFRVRAVGGAGAGAESNLARAVAFHSAPGAPTGLTAVPQADGSVRLSWTAPAGEVWHAVHQRDVTAGETEFTTWPLPVAEGTTATAQYLTHGHEYEFKVTATNRGGESLPSNVVRATASYSLPGAPTGLSAVAQADGSVRLSWTAPAGQVWHAVYQRDVTAGETQFTQWPLPVSEGTVATAQYLTHGHEYEFKVTATNPAGASSPSNLARATATYPLPLAPLALTVTAGDGQASLSWTAAQSGVWHAVYQRDVTAGETQFTAWPLPVSEGTSATAQYLVNGHEYEFKVVGTNGTGEGPASNTVRVTPLPAKPATPTGLTATQQGDGTIKLAWQAPGANLWYVVYQRDVTAGESAYSKWPLPVSEGTTATASYLTHGHQYDFKVAATNAAGESAATAPVRATAHMSPPAAPTQLRGTASGDGKIELNWTAPAPNVYSVIYWRDVTAGQTNFTRVEYLTAETSITMEYLQHAHIYEYKVAATTAGGEGPASTTIRVTAFYNLPQPPANLSAAAGDGKATLTWSASPTPNVNYLVSYRDTTIGQSWQSLSYPVSGTSVVMEYLTNGHTYQFRVAASNSAGQSVPTNTASAKPLPPLPQPPTGLGATAGDGKVTLNWTASSTANVWYWIEMRDATAGQAWTRLKDPVDARSIVLNFMTNGHVYEFRVRSNNAAGDSAPTNVVSARPMPPFPQAPTGLVASPGDGKVNLQWTASSTPYVYYLIELRDTTAGQAWTQLAYPVNGTSVALNYLTNGHSYEFRVRTTNMSGNSGPSNVASARPMPPFPQPPTGLTAAPSNGIVSLNWSASPTSGVWYDVYQRDATVGEAWRKLPLPVTKCCAMAVNYLIPGRAYEFKVVATNVAGVSSSSNVARVTVPLPAQPGWINAVQAGPYEAKISWANVPGADSYVIYHGVSNDVWSPPVMDRMPYPVTGTNFTVGYLLRPGIHWFAVAASRYGATGAKSNSATMSPLMENSLYYEARYRYFDAPPASEDRKLVTSAPRASQDGGIILARAFIGSKNGYQPIADHRASVGGYYSSVPYASARMHAAWDTGRGQLGAYAQKSCSFYICKTALPIVEGYSSADDGDPVGYNYIWKSSGGASSLTFSWKASNSDTNQQGWPLAAKIDTEVTIWSNGGSDFNARLLTDHFPSYEVYQYPHYSTNGFPTARTLVQCDQYNINGLNDEPWLRRQCT